MLTILIKTLYCYLFGLAVYVSVTAVKMGLAFDKHEVPIHPVLYAMHVMILGLGCIQIYQTVNLIIMPLTGLWWVPFICKHFSLILYIVFLRFIKWRHELEVSRALKENSNDK